MGTDTRSTIQGRDGAGRVVYATPRRAADPRRLTRMDIVITHDAFVAPVFDSRHAAQKMARRMTRLMNRRPHLALAPARHPTAGREAGARAV